MSSKKTKTEQTPTPQGDMFVQHHRDVKLQQYTDSLERTPFCSDRRASRSRQPTTCYAPQPMTRAGTILTYHEGGHGAVAGITRVEQILQTLQLEIIFKKLPFQLGKR